MLTGLIVVDCIYDDIVIAGKNKQEVYKSVLNVLGTLTDAGLMDKDD